MYQRLFGKMRRGRIILALLFLTSSYDNGLHALVPSNDAPNPEEIAKSFGYYAESHTVPTPDGYILTLHRIVNPNVHWNSSPEPFILQHGLFSNSAQWTILEPKQGLAFMLADQGFDVWMTNIRGNMYSRRHEHLQPDSVEFWDFSFHEHGTIDMPTMIDYILRATKHKQVWYAGHSMGTTTFFVMGSMRPEYNKKIRHMFALAPVAYMSHIKSPLKSLAPFARSLESLAKTAFNGVLKSDYVLMKMSRDGACNTLNEACAMAFNAGFGYNPRSNTTTILQSLRYLPDYVSSKELVHFAQLINMDFTFRLYDYNELNMVKYISVEPPRYPIEKITAPVTFCYSRNDHFSEPVDVETFAKNLPNVRMYLIPDPEFNHMDFILATYANEVLYKPMLEMIQVERMRRKPLSE